MSTCQKTTFFKRNDFFQILLVSISLTGKIMRGNTVDLDCALHSTWWCFSQGQVTMYCKRQLTNGGSRGTHGQQPMASRFSGAGRSLSDIDNWRKFSQDLNGQFRAGDKPPSSEFTISRCCKTLLRPK